jgi:hypothetical protein
MSEEHKFVIVHEDDDGWTLGRPGDPFLRFDSRDAAIERGRQLLARIHGATLVVDDERSASANR